MRAIDGRASAWVLVSIALFTAGCTLTVDPHEEEKVMPPRLYRVILPVADMEAAVTFYSGLLELPGERVSPGRHYFNLGGTILAVYSPAADGDPPADGWRHHPNQYLYVGVPDLDAALGRARDLGAEILGEGIQSMPWGERLFYARDPSGNPICLVDDETLFLGGAGDQGPS